MKRLTLFLLAAALCALCACGEIWPEETSAAAETTQEITTAPLHELTMPEPITAPPPLPPREGAVMPPLQGGPMLYAFHGNDKAIGLIDDMAVIVAKPQYDSTTYIYDAQGRVTGLLARAAKTRKFVHYDLLGHSRPLDCAGQMVWRGDIAGGRYMRVDTALDETWEVQHPPKQGLFDIQGNRWLVAPEEEQTIKAYHDRVLVHSADRAYEYYLRDSHTRKLPNGCDAFLEEVGWYRIGGWGGWEYYDVNLKHLPQLDGCLINPGMGGGGVYILVYTYWNGLDTALVDRNGKFIDTQYSSLNSSGQCWIGKGGAEENAPAILLDRNLQPIYTLKKGEEFVELMPLHGSIDPAGLSLLVQNEKGDIVRVFDMYGKALQSTGTMQRFRAAYDGYIYYALENGTWSKLEGIPYENRPEDDFFSVHPLVTADDYLVIWAGWEYEWESDPQEIFSIDWNGELIKDCPLAPFFANLENRFESAGPQGPNYYWVTLGDDSGYINEKGEWLFKHN